MLISFFGDNQTITLGVCTNKRMDFIYLQDLFKIHMCIALGAFYLLVLNSKIACSTTVMKKIWKWDRMNHRLSGDIWNKIHLGILLHTWKCEQFFSELTQNIVKYYSSTKRISFLCCFGKCVEKKSRKQKFFPWEILSSFTHPKGDPKPNYWWLLAPSQLFFFILIKII